MQIVLGLFVAFVLLALFSNRRTRRCRWRAYPAQEMWRCVMCGAEAPGAAEKAPQDCAMRRPGSGA